MLKISNHIGFDLLPFYWRVAEKNALNIVPSQLPFVFDFNTDINLIKQAMTDDLAQHLKTIYKAESNIGYLQDSNLLAKPYALDLLNYLLDVIAQKSKVSLDILEIGCGGCVILEELVSYGHRVLGVDPSPIAVQAGLKKNINVIPDFFPSESIPGKYDLIFHSDVLEHVPDPVAFLRSHDFYLKDKGLILISVPDCTESIELGDSSMVIHQHLNYFDLDSLPITCKAAGYNVLTVDKAKYGGSLYCLAQKTNESLKFTPNNNTDKFDLFTSKFIDAHNNFNRIIANIVSDPDRTIGFYVPLRTFPYLALCPLSFSYRLFDDTHHWHYKYIDGNEVKIENMQDLIENPVTDLFIMSLTFGEAIKNKVKNSGLNTNIYILSELVTTRS